MGNIKIKAYPNGIFGATVYLVSDNITKEALLIDCTSSIDEITDEIKKENLNLKYVLITHGHFDHVFCVGELKKIFPNIPVMINKDDMPLLNNVEAQCAMAGLEGIKVPCVDALIDENTKNLKIGKFEIKIIHTPGHSMGGVCYLINDEGQNILFSGDTLFEGSIGRCDLFGGDFNKIIKSIKEKLFVLDPKTVVYPGHGHTTTIGDEIKHNPYFI